MNGDLRVAYRASREGPRDIVFVPNWFTCCERSPGAAVHSRVGRGDGIARSADLLRPAGTGASDPVSTGALPTLEQWADSITAVLDDLGSREAVLLAGVGAFATGALFAATHPSRTTALVVLRATRIRWLSALMGPHSRRSLLPWSPCGERGNFNMS